MNSIFSKMECDHSVIEDSLGSSTGISENNVMTYLGLVEQKTNELLTIQAFLNSKVTCQPVVLSYLFLHASLLFFLPRNITCFCICNSYRIWKRTTIQKIWRNFFWVRIQNFYSRVLTSNLHSTGRPLIPVCLLLVH